MTTENTPDDDTRERADDATGAPGPEPAAPSAGEADVVPDLFGAGPPDATRPDHPTDGPATRSAGPHPAEPTPKGPTPKEPDPVEPDPVEPGLVEPDPHEPHGPDEEPDAAEPAPTVPDQIEADSDEPRPDAPRPDEPRPDEPGESDTVQSGPEHVPARDGAGTAPGRRVLVTGAAGHVGRLLVAALAADPAVARVVEVDDEAGPEMPPAVPGLVRHTGVHAVGDLVALVRAHELDAVVHVATVDVPAVAGGPEQVGSTAVAAARRAVDAAAAAGLGHVTVVGSAAAYGHHPTNRGRRLDEDQPLRGGAPFDADRVAAAVEHVLGTARRRHPQVRQAVLRVADVLGPGLASPTTDLLGARVLPGLRDGPVTFAFAWDADVVAVVVAVVLEGRVGTWNVAGDGVVTLRDVAAVTGARVVPVGSRLGARVVRRLGAGDARDPAAHPAALRHRPVPAVDRLRADLPGVVTHSSHDAVVHWATGRAPR